MRHGNPSARPLRHLAFMVFGCWIAFVIHGCGMAASEFNQDKLDEIDAAIQGAIHDGRCPGAVFWLEHRKVSYCKTYGNRMVKPGLEPVTEDTIFDVASLTKVFATTPAVMKLVEQGKVDLEATVTRYLPEFGGDGKESITVRQLMTHTSGLRAGLSPKPVWSGAEKAIGLASAEPLPNPPGTVFRYSDINFILLGEIVHRVSGQSLDRFADEQIFKPLKMSDTQFLPGTDKLPRTAPTAWSDGGMLRGQVHDPTARRMGGVAGHAGLFTTAPDVARYARMMLGLGESDGVRLFQAPTVTLMMTVQSPASVPARRGLGWDIDSPYSGPRGDIFAVGGFGHTGWTGGSIWIDPGSETFVIFLTNRNHPDDGGNVVSLWRKLGTLAAEAIAGFD